ncbi:hypothetical protein [Endozoicomonas sp. 2B-B]
MNTRAKPQPTEINHIRNTLTDVVDGLGQTRGEMHQRFDQQEKEHNQFRHEVNQQFAEFNERFGGLEHEVHEVKARLGGLEHEVHEVKVRFDGLEQKVDRQGSEISEIKEMLQTFLSRQ